MVAYSNSIVMDTERIRTQDAEAFFVSRGYPVRPIDVDPDDYFFRASKARATIQQMRVLVALSEGSAPRN